MLPTHSQVLLSVEERSSWWLHKDTDYTITADVSSLQIMLIIIIQETRLLWTQINTPSDFVWWDQLYVAELVCPIFVHYIPPAFHFGVIATSTHSSTSSEYHSSEYTIPAWNADEYRLILSPSEWAYLCKCLNTESNHVLRDKSIFFLYAVASIV